MRSFLIITGIISHILWVLAARIELELIFHELATTHISYILFGDISLSIPPLPSILGINAESKKMQPEVIPAEH